MVAIVFWNFQAFVTCFRRYFLQPCNNASPKCSGYNNGKTSKTQSTRACARVLVCLVGCTKASKFQINLESNSKLIFLFFAIPLVLSFIVSSSTASFKALSNAFPNFVGFPFTPCHFQWIELWINVLSLGKNSFWRLPFNGIGGKAVAAAPLGEEFTAFISIFSGLTS